MKKIINWLFPEKSKWIDIYCFNTGGYYKLIQMRHEIKTNKKEFRTAKIGFINDYTVKSLIYTNVLKSNHETN